MSMFYNILTSASLFLKLFFSVVSTFSEIFVFVLFEEKNQLFIFPSFVSFCCSGVFCWVTSCPFLEGKCFVRDPSQLEVSVSFFFSLERDDTFCIPGFTFVFFSHIVGEKYFLESPTFLSLCENHVLLIIPQIIIAVKRRTK